jgi:hypothetical protein
MSDPDLPVRKPAQRSRPPVRTEMVHGSTFGGHVTRRDGCPHRPRGGRDRNGWRMALTRQWLRLMVVSRGRAHLESAPIALTDSQSVNVCAKMAIRTTLPMLIRTSL